MGAIAFPLVGRRVTAEPLVRKMGRGFGVVALAIGVAGTAAVLWWVLGVLAVAANARDSFKTIIATRYPDNDAAHAYFSNLRASLRRIQDQPSPLPFTDGAVPTFVIPYGKVLSRQSELLSLFDVTVRSRRHGYRIASSGRLVPPRRR